MDPMSTLLPHAYEMIAMKHLKGVWLGVASWQPTLLIKILSTCHSYSRCIPQLVLPSCGHRRTLQRKFQLILSRALDISKLRQSKSYLLICTKCKFSWPIIIFLVRPLSSSKATLLWSMIILRMDFICMDTGLGMILCNKLHLAVDLK